MGHVKWILSPILDGYIALAKGCMFLKSVVHDRQPAHRFIKRKGWKNMIEEVQCVLDELRPNLQADGGDVELTGVDEKKGIVRVRLTGACRGCPMSQLTLQMGIERILKRDVPEVKKVIAV